MVVFDARRFLVSVVVLPATIACGGKTATRPGAPGRPLALAFETEEHAVVAEISQRVIDLVRPADKIGPAVAVRPSVPRDPGRPVYRVRAGRTTEIALAGYLWAPSNYAALVAGRPTRDVVCERTDLMERLLTPTLSNLDSVDRTLSEALSKRPGDPCLHETAALLIGAFELRSTWLLFWDPRPSMNRMSAHLAVAHALRGGGEPGPAGRVADLLLRTLAFRQDGFEAELAALSERAAEPERTWLRVVQLYSIQDWRVLKRPAEASLAERLAFVLALANKTDSNRVQDFLDTQQEPGPEFKRLAFQRGFSIEACHRYARPALDRTLAEARSIYELRFGRAPAATELVEALNATDRQAPLRVLDWALWAGFEQRAILGQIWAEQSCLRDGLGLPESAAEQRGDIDAEFGDLRLFPLFLRWTADTPDEYARAMSGALRLLSARPQDVTWMNWMRLARESNLGPLPPDLPDERAFFEPRLPLGTAFDYNRRLWDRSSGEPRLDVAQLDEIRGHVFHAIARTLYARARWGDAPPAAELKRIFGDQVNFDRDALVAITDAARDSDPDAFKEAAAQMCVLSADDCDVLGDFLAERGEAKEAARALERWVDGARDRVAISNGVEWLALHYLETGQKARAFALGHRADAVGSGGGMRTLGRLYEESGQLDEAEQQFQRILVRYENPGALIDFYVRQRKSPRYAEALNQMVRDAFPNGPQAVRKEDFGPARPRGVYVETLPWYKYMRDDVAVFDVIVAVDGIRVENLAQFRLQWRLSKEEKPRLSCWRRGALVEASVKREHLPWYGYARDPR